MVNVKIEKLHSKAIIPFKTHNSDFCYDVVAIDEKEITSNVWRYTLGFKYEIDRESLYNYSKNLSKNINISLDFRPRSSIWKTGMILSNSEGTLDEMYRGEVSAIFYHIFPNMPRYKVGDKIGQIKLGLTLPINFIEDKVNDDTERGVNGFGSTGK